MTAPETHPPGPPIAVGAWIVAALATTSMALGAPLQDAPGNAEVRAVSAAAQPCLNLRESPSYRARIIGCIEIGTEVVVSSAQNGWSRVSSTSEGDGWVGTRHLEPPTRTTTPASEPVARPAPSSEPGTGSLSAERDALAERLAEATAQIATLEAELTRLTLAGDEASLQEQTQSERDQLPSDLAAAEQRAADLEAELASTRAAWGGTAQEQRELSEAVAELTAERDSLASELARAEARQLYLQSDLEATRAELMQLKGIPPKLVMPRQEPTVVTLPPIDPEPAAVEPTIGVEAEAEPGPELRGNPYQMEEVVAAVRAWAEAWSSQRVEDYLSFYAPGFEPLDGLDRSSWEQSRRERLTAPRSIEISLDRISPTVSGSNAIVLLEQTYVSDSFRDVVDKTLVLELIDGLWRIVRERVNR